MNTIRQLILSRTKALTRTSLGLTALCLAMLSPQIHAQDKPPLKIVVGFPPGGSADILARMVADALRDDVGTIVVDNKPGAGGRIALNAVKTAKPDGQTVIILPSGPMVLFPHVYKKLDYDAVKDFTPISQIARFQFGVVSGPSSNVKSVAEMIAKAKTGSGKTAAFGIALLEKLNVRFFGVQALVLCPTRELADQVAKEIRRLARLTHNVKVLTLCGGVSIGPQIGSLERGAHIVVGTPGRIVDHIAKGTLKLDSVNQLVLDEAGITLNKNNIPNDPRSPFVTSGVRIGVPSVTTQGMREAEMPLIAEYIATTLRNRNDPTAVAEVRGKVAALCAKFPVYPKRA